MLSVKVLDTAASKNLKDAPVGRKTMIVKSKLQKNLVTNLKNEVIAKRTHIEIE